MMQYQSTLDLWLARAAEDPDLTAELEAVRSDPDGVTDRFYRDLAFGTGGLRGVIGAGTNRMNIYTIRRATQGLADYLNASGLEPVLMLLERMGIPAENITVVPRQREPDGDFPHLPLPQPRDPGGHADRPGPVRPGPPRPDAGHRPRLRPDGRGCAGRPGRLPSDHRQRDGSAAAGLQRRRHRPARCGCAGIPPGRRGQVHGASLRHRA